MLSLKDVCIMVRNRFCLLPYEVQKEWLYKEWGLDVHPMTEFNQYCKDKYHGDYLSLLYQAENDDKFKYSDPWFAWRMDNDEFISGMSIYEISFKDRNDLLIDVFCTEDRLNSLGFTDEEKKKIMMTLNCFDDDKHHEAWESMLNGL